jgi:predicted neutral ceramidase superfamily lipid hydrolase
MDLCYLLEFFVVYLTLLLLQEKSKESVRLKSELYLNVACQNIWKMLHSKSMSRSQYLYSLYKVFVSVLSCRNVMILFLKQIGGRNTVLERAFVHNGIPFEVPTIIFGADFTHAPPGENSASSIAAVSFFS